MRCAKCEGAAWAEEHGIGCERRPGEAQVARFEGHETKYCGQCWHPLEHHAKGCTHPHHVRQLEAEVERLRSQRQSTVHDEGNG